MHRRALLIGAAAWAASPAFANSAATLQAVNRFRVRNRRKLLIWSTVLESVAQGHADDMASGGFFSHRGSDGSDIGERLHRAGYRYCAAAENIAQGQRSIGLALTSWARSRSHRRNMLSREMAEMAVAQADGDIWVMVLGRSGC